MAGRFPLLLLPVLLVGSAFAGEAPEPVVPRELDSFHLLSGLARISEHDPLGLGAEAERARAWASGRSSLSLRGLHAGEPVLADGDAEWRLSPELGRGLGNLRSYMEAAWRARRDPVAVAELVEASLVAAGVERIRAAFDEAIASSLVLDGGLVVPELGGEAVVPPRRQVDAALARGLPGLRWGLKLHRFRDPTRAALQAVALGRHDPAALTKLFESAGEDLLLLDDDGQLRSELALYEQRGQRGVPLERRRRSLERAVDTTLRNGADSFTLHPRAQLEAILEQGGSRWPGRLVGLWHLHPPGWSDAGWLAAAPPSPDDRQVARTTGQFLTIVFHPEGFDLHDLRSRPSGEARTDSEEPVVRYRSEEWRDHFAASWERARERVKRETLTTSP